MRESIRKFKSASLLMLRRFMARSVYEAVGGWVEQSGIHMIPSDLHFFHAFLDLPGARLLRVPRPLVSDVAHTD